MTRANWLWAICGLFALYTVWFGVFPASASGGIQGLSITAMLVVFALVHGAGRYGWSGILVFFAIWGHYTKVL